jgi:ankyrin repeat protein
VFCQLDTLQHCFPPNLRQFLNELPDTLDETYEQMLKCINKAQKDDAYRLLQCLAVAVRPLRVGELAELLAFDFQATSSGGIPNLKADWRWDDHEEAVLSTCSSLITIVRNGDSRVVQFSHFSVKEYLTSPRLARSHGDVSRFYIDLERAHTIMVQACLGTLLRLDEHAVNSDAQRFPLVEYAARHWVDHARFEKVSSRVQDGIDDLFDSSKPHFATWLRMHNLDEVWDSFSFSGRPPGQHYGGSPLYYAAFCGLYDLTERLIVRHPELVNAVGGRIVAPLPAALHGKHFQVADLLIRHGATVDVRGLRGRTLLHRVSMFGQIDEMRWLLKHGADVHSRQNDLWTPLHLAAANDHPEAVQVLLDHKADVNSRNEEGNPPLHEAFFYTGFFDEKTAASVVLRLLEHGADPNTRDDNQSNSTPLHIASSQGWLEVARLLLSHGANVDEKDKEGRTPFQVATSKGHVEMTKLLLEYGANPEP